MILDISMYFDIRTIFVPSSMADRAQPLTLLSLLLLLKTLALSTFVSTWDISQTYTLFGKLKDRLTTYFLPFP